MGDLGSIPGLGRSPGEGKIYPLQYSGLENSMDYTGHGVAKSWTRLSDFHTNSYLGIRENPILPLTKSFQLFLTPWTIQTMEFSRPEYWSGQSFSSPGDLPNPEIKPRLPSLQVNYLPAEPQGKPKNTGVGSLSLLQWIFPTQELNRGLPHCRQILYQLSHKGSPRILEWVAYPFSRGSSQPRNRIGVSCFAGGFFTNGAIREDLVIVCCCCC